MQLTCQQLADLPQVVAQLREWAGPLRVWLWEGQMGAGKTTMIRELCKQLGVVDNVSSPTFAIVNQYQTAQGHGVYHFDFYRIKSEQEALDIGCEEYFYSGDYCLIEWAERIPSLLPEKYLRISIGVGQHQERLINVAKHE